MYDEPVIWPMTECGALPDITDAELDAATSEHHWICSPQATNCRPSHPTVGNNEAHPNLSKPHQAHRSKKSESKGGASRKSTPNTTQKSTGPSPPTAKPSRRVPKSARTTMPARHQPPSQAPYRSQPHPPQGGRGNSTNTENNQSSRKRTSQQSNGPHSKRQRATGNEQRGSRIRPQPDQDPTAPSNEPPRSRPRPERAPMDHLALTKREIPERSTQITDENTSLRRRKAHALHFLGAQDATAVKGQYHSLSLLLHPHKNRRDPMATERFKVLGAAKDLFYERIHRIATLNASHGAPQRDFENRCSLNRVTLVSSLSPIPGWQGVPPCKDFCHQTANNCMSLAPPSPIAPII